MTTDLGGATAHVPSLVPDLVAELAATRPDSVAMEADDQRLSFGDLIRRADAVAATLRSAGVAPDDRVALTCPPSIEYVVGALGIMRAGAAYLPIDPAYPEARRGIMLSDADVRVILDRASVLSACADQLSSPARLTGSSLAYVIYTSGSTGTPKAVAVEHASLANLVSWHLATFRPAPGDRVCLGAGVSFDASVWEIWSNLAGGATLIVPDQKTRRDPVRLRDFILSRSVTSMFAATPLAQELCRLRWPDSAPFRLLHTGGEALRARPPAGLPFALVNHYGPTEATVIATSTEVTPGPGVPTIGVPITGVRAHLLDTAGHGVPEGEVGELCLGGVALARGYLGRPDLTAERFPAHPELGRMYRTGDLVRQRPDGELEYVGRVDDQVQVRGYRVEPAEVEAALFAHPSVVGAAVLGVADGTGHTSLAGFYASGEPIAGLRSWLLDRLPAHLVPSTLTWCERLPLTANGKVDRAALLRVEAYGEDKKATPRSATEAAVAAVWREVFGIDTGVDMPFDSIGGHSLHAMRIVARLRDQLAVDVPLEVFFGRSVTVADLAASIDAGAWAAAGVTAGRIRPEPEPAAGSPLTAAQRRYWFIGQFVPDQSLYNVAVSFTISGDLDPQALAASLADLVRRHPALRTSIVDTPDGLRQRLVAVDDVAFEEHDVQAEPERADELFFRSAGVPFTLSRPPLLRAVLARVAGRRWRLCLITHHVAMDASSIPVLMADLADCYTETTARRAGIALPGSAWRGGARRGGACAEPPGVRSAEPPGVRSASRQECGQGSPRAGAGLESGAEPGAAGLSFGDVARWEAQRLSGDSWQQLAGYWRTTLHDAPVLLNLPTDHRRPAVGSYAGATVTQPVPADLLRRVDEMAAAYGVSRFMVLLAALTVVLYRHSGQTDIVVGTPVANREMAEFESMVGCFVNTVPLRCDLAARPGFGELLGRVRRTALGAFAHEALPFDEILEAVGATRPRAHHPLFTVMLVAQPPIDDVPMPGAVLRYGGELHTDKARFDLTVVFEQADGQPVLGIEYALDLFTEATAHRLLTHVLRVLAGAAADPQLPVDRIPLIDEAETAQVLAWGTGPAPRTDVERPAYRLVEQRCAERPDHLAVNCGLQQLTYAQLNARANRLALRLRELGVSAGTAVGVLLPRSVDSVVAMLAVAKSGGVYVPMDRAYPDERLGMLLADARPVVVVSTDAERLARLAPADLRLHVERPDQERGTEGGNLGDTADAEDLAYIIYTSGSTGTPKGVAVHHRALANVTAAKVEGFDVRPDSRVLQFVSFGFGVSITDAYMTLTAGATLIVRPDEALAGRDLADLVRQHAVTNLVLPASMLAALPEEPLPSVRAIAVGGEPCSAALVDQWAPGRRFVQAYGPTEAAVASTMAFCQPGAGTPPIGRPIPGARVYVLDEHLNPAPVGVPGELCIAGLGVSRGYVNRPDLTDTAFRPDPFGDGRMYRTGDIARWRADGQLVLSGRFDDQVQLRGIRIELGDVESALRAHPAVREAAAAVREHEVAGQLLVGYLVADAMPSVAELREFLAQRLPEHAVPAAYVPLAQLPRTVTGKLDRRTLPDPPEPAAVVPSRPPASVTEEVLAEIWGNTLSRDREPLRFGADEDFFVLGGQSILAAEVMAQVRERFEIDLPVRALFEAPTIAALAVRVEQEIVNDLMREDEAESQARSEGIAFGDLLGPAEAAR